MTPIIKFHTLGLDLHTNNGNSRSRSKGQSGLAIIAYYFDIVWIRLIFRLGDIMATLSFVIQYRIKVIKTRESFNHKSVKRKHKTIQQELSVC